MGTPPPFPTLGTPYCNNCKYPLTGLTDSSRCPECGKPLVDVLVRDLATGKRWQSQTKLGSLPLVAIALGPAPGERIGRPRGVIAIGDAPTGILAIGALPRGVIALGALPVGVVSLGAIATGLFASGGIALGGIALGGVAIGVFAAGSLCIALVKGWGVLVWRLL